MTRVGAARVAVVAAEVWLLTTVAHAVAGGELPSLPWLLGLGALVAVATTWVLRSRVTPWLVAGGLAAAQLGLHVALGAIGRPAPRRTPGMAMGGHAHDHTALTTPRRPGLDPDSSTACRPGWWWRTSSAPWSPASCGGSAAASWPRCCGSDDPRPSSYAGARSSPGEATATRPHPRPWLLGDPGRAPPRELVTA